MRNYDLWKDKINKRSKLADSTAIRFDLIFILWFLKIIFVGFSLNKNTLTRLQNSDVNHQPRQKS